MFASSCPGFFFVCVIYFLRLTFAKENICGILYEDENQVGKKFEMTDLECISNFQEHYLSASLDVWNMTRSVKITQGCTLISCDDNYFAGSCIVYENSLEAIKLHPGHHSIGSANCTCQSECNCSDILLKKTECARAYLEGGCESCISYYINIRNAEEQLYYRLARENISNVVIRPECKLEAFDEELFQGESRTFKGIVEKRGNEEFGSYKCTCTDANPTSILDPRPDQSFIDIANSADDIRTQLLTHKGHPGIISSLQSIKKRRSPKNAYILVLGTKGSGKLSVVKTLLGNSKDVSVLGNASDIHEFKMRVPLTELGVANSELRIIEVPTLGDTRGPEKDSRSLATLDEYLNRHEELRKYTPNVVLILTKFHNHQRNSSFVKMMRLLNSFMDRLSDKTFSNVVFVFTHYMRANGLIRRQPGQRLKEFKELIEEFSSTPEPIIMVVADNKCHEEGVPMLNGSYKLPNGDLYPKNLLDKMQFAAISGGDILGEAILRTVRQSTNYFNISSSSFPLVSREHPGILKYIDIPSLSDYYVPEVALTLKHGFDLMNETLQKKFPGSLAYLQRFFNIRNIHLDTDVPRTSEGILKLLKGMRINEAITAILENGLSITIPEIPSEILIVGRGYDLVTDLPLLTSPFKTHKKIVSDIVYKIPDYFNLRVQDERKRVYKVFSTMEEYDMFRIQRMNVPPFHRGSGFPNFPKPGYNIVTNQVNHAVQEYQSFKLLLNDNYDLSEEFVQALDQLPQFPTSDYYDIRIWKTFFKRFGTHVVISVHGGGMIEIRMNRNETDADAMFDILDSVDKYFGILGDSELSLKFKGGNLNNYAATLSKINSSTAADLFEDWKDSLQYNPIILDSDIKLLEISEVVKKYYKYNNLSVEIERATCAFYGWPLNCRVGRIEVSHIRDARNSSQRCLLPTPMPSQNIKIICRRTVHCSSSLSAGSTIVVKCLDNYEFKWRRKTEVTLRCNRGRWEGLSLFRELQCKIKCGEPTVRNIGLVMGGKETERLRYPWHVAIFKEKFYACGGSIINPFGNELIVLTALHCLLTPNGVSENPDDFTIIVGAISSNFSENDGVTGTQIFKIKSIAGHDSYDSMRYTEDIALILTDKPIRVTQYSLPVCLPTVDIAIGGRHSDNIFSSGVVLGFGSTAGLQQPPAEVLHKVIIPILPTDSCIPNANFIPSMSQICAGVLGGANTCIGDSGGGLLFKEYRQTSMRYIIQGIVSSGSSTYNCSGVSIFTRVYSFLEWIEYETEYLLIDHPNYNHSTTAHAQ